jgi:hypothetical protein
MLSLEKRNKRTLIVLGVMHENSKRFDGKYYTRALYIDIDDTMSPPRVLELQYPHPKALDIPGSITSFRATLAN